MSLWLLGLLGSLLVWLIRVIMVFRVIRAMFKGLLGLSYHMRLLGLFAL
jgi:hypothetical protein